MGRLLVRQIWIQGASGNPEVSEFIGRGGIISSFTITSCRRRAGKVLLFVLRISWDGSDESNTSHSSTVQLQIGFSFSRIFKLAVNAEGLPSCLVYWSASELADRRRPHVAWWKPPSRQIRWSAWGQGYGCGYRISDVKINIRRLGIESCSWGLLEQHNLVCGLVLVSRLYRVDHREAVLPLRTFCRTAQSSLFIILV